jgi:hypothetical protein
MVFLFHPSVRLAAPQLNLKLMMIFFRRIGIFHNLSDLRRFKTRQIEGSSAICVTRGVERAHLRSHFPYSLIHEDFRVALFLFDILDGLLLIADNPG